MLRTTIDTLDQLLGAHAAQLGADFTAYRNHTYRVASLCVALSPDGPAQLQKIAIAAALHDIGIWTAGTFDYLSPSAAAARAHLDRIGRPDWTPEIVEMILQHHKILPYRAHPQWLVEPFRRADLVDVSRGLITFGLPRSFLRELSATWPNAGFHRLLVRLGLKRFRTHPWDPAPMMKI